MQTFNVSREKDDKDYLVQNERQYFSYMMVADQPKTRLHLDYLMAAFSCVKAMYSIISPKLSKEDQDKIEKDTDAISAKVDNLTMGGPNDNKAYLAGIQKDIEELYRGVKCKIQ